MISVDILFDLLSNAKYNSRRDHLFADCPFCGKEKHLYISVNKENNPFDCKHCLVNGKTIFPLLLELDRTDLWEQKKRDLSEKIELKFEVTEDDEEELEIPTIKLPIGSKRIYESEYLTQTRKRNNEFYIPFSRKDFENYPVFSTNLKAKYRDYVLFSVFSSGEIKGFVSRYTGKDKNKKRYLNSSTAFSCLLYGEDEIEVGKTKTVICVEGIFDKRKLDIHFNLLRQEEMKAVCTFGKKLSRQQFKMLKRKGIDNIILIYDKDAIQEMKKYSNEACELFNVLVGFIDGSKDLDESSPEEIDRLFRNDLHSPSYFDLNYVSLNLR